MTEATHEIAQETINQTAWSACDIFRGVMDAANYKDYILVMLFFKYLSDVDKERRNQLDKQYGGNQKRIDRALRRESFRVPEGTNFYSLYEKRQESNIGELINEALQAIEDDNKAKLEGVFRNIDFNSETVLGQTRDRNRRLSQLLELFGREELDLNPARVSEDIIGNTYMYLVERFASDAGKKAGEFYTPHKVSQLVASLCNPQPGARICDPACGSGGLLIEAARKVRTNDFSLWGMEVNGGTWALSRMNMFLHDYNSSIIKWCNTLTDPQLLENDRLMDFDNVVANPPFSLRKWGAETASTDRHERFHRGIPPKATGDYAFISHMLKVAKRHSGRIASVASHGVLFRGGAEGRIRQSIIQENLLDAVIGLPAKLFASTSIPVAILIFDRSREAGGANAKRTDVLFIDASNDYATGKSQNSLLDKHIAKITQTYKERKSIERYAHLATRAEIEGNGFNLNIPRYIDTFEPEAEVDIYAVESEIETLEEELKRVRASMKKILGELRQ